MCALRVRVRMRASPVYVRVCMCVCMHVSVNMRAHSRVFAENLLTDSWDGGWHNPVIRRCVRLQSWCVCVCVCVCVYHTSFQCCVVSTEGGRRMLVYIILYFYFCIGHNNTLFLTAGA
jgi:hypothetical protein